MKIHSQGLTALTYNGRAMIFRYISGRTIAERGGRDRFPNGPREWLTNEMPFPPVHSQHTRPDASEKRPCHGARRFVCKTHGNALGFKSVRISSPERATQWRKEGMA
jgi:hypothetical protein